MVDNFEYQKENLAVAAKYLGNMGLSFEIQDLKLLGQTYPALVFHHSVLGKHWKVYVLAKDVGVPYFNIKALITTYDRLRSGENRLTDIYKECLVANFVFDEVTFSADPSGSLWAEVDVPVQSDELTFKLEVESIATAIEYFVTKIAKKYQIAFN